MAVVWNTKKLIKAVAAVAVLVCSTSVFAAQYVWTSDVSKHASTKPEVLKSAERKFPGKCIYADYRFEPGDMLALGDIHLVCAGTEHGAMWFQAVQHAKASRINYLGKTD